MGCQYSVIKLCRVCSSGSMVFSWEIYPYQRTTYFRDGPDPVCRNMQSAVYLHSSTVGLLERLDLLDWDGVTSGAVFACVVGVWLGATKESMSA